MRCWILAGTFVTLSAQCTPDAADTLLSDAVNAELLNCTSLLQTSAKFHRAYGDMQESWACKLLPMHEEIWERASGGYSPRAATAERTVTSVLPDHCRRLPFETLELSFEKDEEHVIGLIEVNDLPLIPYPASVQKLTDVGAGGRSVAISADTRVVLNGIDDGDFAVKNLRMLLSTHPALNDDVFAPVTLHVDPHVEVGDEGYMLEIRQDGVKLSAPASTGIFYGIQTLRQLASRSTTSSTVLPMLKIRDEPHLQWRGLHLDVSRHFFGPTDIKKLLDTMASFKFNRFHWHLTDDQGWRLPVEGYPDLTQIGAEGVTKGAYTVDEIKDVVAYAKERHIEVLPEVDIPGHNAAAISAYNELGNSDVPSWQAPNKPPTTWGVHPYTLSPSNASMAFLKAVFAQVHELFPGAFVHIGGDEAPTEQWKRSPHARSVLQASGDRHVQSFFNRKLADLLDASGKTFVGWDEVQDMEGLPDNAVIMAWRGSNEVNKAARAGRRVINSEQGSLYFDHYQGPMATEPEAFGSAVTSLENVYAHDPVPSSLTKEQQKLVIGTQGQLWSEFLPTWDHVEYMAHPRSLALAERAWTRSKTSFADFRKRLEIRLADLDDMSVNYRRLD